MAEVLRHWLVGDDYQPGEGGGFMGRDWDSFVPGPTIWKALADITYPGGILAAYGGTRTADLLGVACRLAGWEKFDEIEVLGWSSFTWVQGQGFPKSQNISKAVDQASGLTGDVVGQSDRGSGASPVKLAHHGTGDTGLGILDGHGKEFDLTSPSSPEGQAWQGYGTALKPAHEPILLFRKPLAKVTSEEIHQATGWKHWHNITTVQKPLRSTLAPLPTDKKKKSADKSFLDRYSSEASKAMAYRARMWKKYGLRLPSGHREVEIVQLKRQSLAPEVETDIQLILKPLQIWREQPEFPQVLATVEQKPHQAWSSQTYVAHALVYGSGTLNIDESRIKAENRDHRQPGEQYGFGDVGVSTGSKAIGITNLGRFPSNVSLIHHPLCIKTGSKKVRGAGQATKPENRTTKNAYGEYKSRSLVCHTEGGKEMVEDWLCHPECPVRLLGEQSGESRSPKTYTRKSKSENQNTWGPGIGDESGDSSLNYDDVGAASR
jgi:hypothetical protein